MNPAYLIACTAIALFSAWESVAQYGLQNNPAAILCALHGALWIAAPWIVTR